MVPLLYLNISSEVEVERNQAEGAESPKEAVEPLLNSFLHLSLRFYVIL